VRSPDAKLEPRSPGRNAIPGDPALDDAARALQSGALLTAQFATVCAAVAAASRLDTVRMIVTIRAQRSPSDDAFAGAGSWRTANGRALQLTSVLPAATGLLLKPSFGQ
jgi:hypothetical protein